MHALILIRSSLEQVASNSLPVATPIPSAPAAAGAASNAMIVHIVAARTSLAPAMI